MTKHIRARAAIRHAIWALGTKVSYKEVERITMEELLKHSEFVLRMQAGCDHNERIKQLEELSNNATT